VGDFCEGDAVFCCIRPEHVTVAREAVPSSARNVFPATLSRIVCAGFQVRLHLDCGFPLVAFVTSHSLESLALKPGDALTVSFKATAVHVLGRKTGG
jgi:tungstate transport system ATP-binding protein